VDLGGVFFKNILSRFSLKSIIFLTISIICAFLAKFYVIDNGLVDINSFLGYSFVVIGANFIKNIIGAILETFDILFMSANPNGSGSASDSASDYQNKGNKKLPKGNGQPKDDS